MGCTGGSVSMTLKKRGRLIKQIVSNVFFGTCHCFLHFRLDKGNRSVTYVKVTDRLPQLIVGEKHETETRKNGRFLPLCGAYRDHHIGGIFGQFDQHGDGARSLLVDLRAGCVHE